MSLFVQEPKACFGLPDASPAMPLTAQNHHHHGIFTEGRQAGDGPQPFWANGKAASHISTGQSTGCFGLLQEPVPDPRATSRNRPSCYCVCCDLSPVHRYQDSTDTEAVCQEGRVVDNLVAGP